jgi:hypothetical protein
VVVYYRDRKGYRHVFGAATILREVKRLPKGSRLAIFWVGPDVVRWVPLGQYDIEVPWNIDERGAKMAYNKLIENLMRYNESL